MVGRWSVQRTPSEKTRQRLSRAVDVGLRIVQTPTKAEVFFEAVPFTPQALSIDMTAKYLSTHQFLAAFFDR
jgi:hypothetical protein